MNRKNRGLSYPGFPGTSIVVLAALLFVVLPLNAFANAEDGQEIGIPQPMETRVNDCFGAYLSPNGDRFHTVHEGMLTQYQISPFKKLGSVAIDRELTKESGCHVLLTDDEKKLIVVYRRWIYVFDTRSGQLLNKSEKGGQIRPTVIINDDDLLVLDRFVNEAVGVSVDLTLWDINTLKVKKKFNQFGRGFGFYPSEGSYPFMSKILDRIYMKSDASLLVLNSKTYEPKLSLLFGPASDSTGIYDHTDPQRLDSPRLTKDFRVLYASSVTKVTDHLNGKETSFNAMKRADVLVFDQKTREFKIESFKSLKLDALDPFIFNPVNSSRNRDYVMLLRYPFQAKLR